MKTSKCLLDWLTPVPRLYGSKLKAEDNRNGNRYIGTISEDSPSIGVNICVCTCAHVHLCVGGGYVCAGEGHRSPCHSSSTVHFVFLRAIYLLPGPKQAKGSGSFTFPVLGL